MPTLTELVAKVNKYPNTATDEEIVEIMDTLQKRLYREFKIPTKEDFELIADMYAYNVGIKPSLIFEVLVDEGSTGEAVIYPKKGIKGGTTATSRYHYFIDDFLGLYPKPSQDGIFSVFSYQVPTTLSSADMDAIPSLDEDYQDILVYGARIELAGEQRDEIINFWIQRYNELERELSEQFSFTPEVETIQSESGW